MPPFIVRRTSLYFINLITFIFRPDSVRVKEKFGNNVALDLEFPIIFPFDSWIRFLFGKILLCPTGPEKPFMNELAVH